MRTSFLLRYYIKMIITSSKIPANCQDNKNTVIVKKR